MQYGILPDRNFSVCPQFIKCSYLLRDFVCYNIKRTPRPFHNETRSQLIGLHQDIQMGPLAIDPLQRVEELYPYNCILGNSFQTDQTLPADNVGLWPSIRQQWFENCSHTAHSQWNSSIQKLIAVLNTSYDQIPEIWYNVVSGGTLSPERAEQGINYTLIYKRFYNELTYGYFRPRQIVSFFVPSYITVPMNPEHIHPP